MSAVVRLQDITDELEVQFDERPAYLNRDTGEVASVSLDLLRMAEESGNEPDLPAWQKPEWQLAREIVLNKRFIRLPTKFDVHDWQIMQEFAESVEPEEIAEDLLNAIHRRGAFGNFRDAIKRYRIEPAWYAFRTEALRQIAIDWCEEHGIEWE